MGEEEKGKGDAELDRREREGREGECEEDVHEEGGGGGRKGNQNKAKHEP